jgi:hypothetical protein
MSGVVKFVAGVALMAVGVFTMGATAFVAAGLLAAKAGVALAALGVLDEVGKLFLPDAPDPSVRQDIEYSGTVMPRRIIYGKMRVGGLNCIRPIATPPENGNNLHQILAIAGHECNAIPSVYFNETEIPAASITAISGTDNDGLVTAGFYAPENHDHAWIRRYLGTSTQTVDYKLNAAAPTLWTSDHRGRGVCYAALTFRISEKKFGSGKPDVSFLVEGKKCYDPRLDVTPGASPTNASYIAYTTNPALQLADYLMDENLGRGIASTKIDWPLVVAAANICDEDVDIPEATTQNRYTASIVLEAAGDDRIHEQNIKALASAMMGTCYRQGGKYRMYAGAALSPSYDLTERDILGDVSIRLETPMGDKYNFIRGTFTDAARNYQDVEFEPRGNAAYESADGDRLPKTVSFKAVTSNYEAQRNGIIVLRRGRMAKTISARFSLAAYKVRPWMVGTMTFSDIGWDEQRVVCTSWKFVGDGTIELSLQEDSSSIWDDPTEEQYAEPGSGGAGTSGTYTPDPPSDLAVASLVGGLEASWTQPLEMLPGDVIELWQHTASTPFASATKIWEGTASSVVLNKDVTTTYYFWVRARAANGNPSSVHPATNGVAGAADDAPVDGMQWTPVAHGSGTVEISGDQFHRTNPGGSLDTGVYSLESYYNGAYVSARPYASKYAQIGLSTTPASSAGYADIDYAWYTNEVTGHAYTYEGGVQFVDGGAFTTDTVLSIHYDGANVRFFMDGVLKRTVGASANLKFHLDSTLTGDSGWQTVRFGPSGAAGADGTDGIAATLSTPAITIQVSGGGVPYSGAYDNAVGSIVVTSGGTDVTASATLSSTPTNCSGAVRTATNTPTTGAKGTYYITNLSADKGYLAIAWSYGGSSGTLYFHANKVYAGRDARYVEDTSITTPVTGTSYAGAFANTPQLTVGPGGTITVATTISSYWGQTNSGTCTLTGQIQYYNVDTAGPWTDVSGATATGSTATWDSGDSSWIPGYLTIPPTTLSASGISVATQFDFRLRLYQTGNATGVVVGSGVCSAGWSG